MSDITKKKSFTKKLESLFKLKYFALIISLLIFLSGLAAIVVGSLRLFHGLKGVIYFIKDSATQPGIHIIEAIDTLLFAVVILVLGGGIFKLFVGDENTFKESTVFSKIKTFKDLKILLWETLLLTLTVWCSLSFFAHPDDLRYEQLILPATIILLALALRLMRDNKE
jgi:uncharacterized membrane protein YqhA